MLFSFWQGPCLLLLLRYCDFAVCKSLNTSVLHEIFIVPQVILLILCGLINCLNASLHKAITFFLSVLVKI
jgi:hypothetical protein